MNETLNSLEKGNKMTQSPSEMIIGLTASY